MRHRVQVWIGNLRHDTTRDDVWRQLYQHFGWNPVSVTIRNPGPWPADQFAFVEFNTPEEVRRNFEFDTAFVILHLTLLVMTSIFNRARQITQSVTTAKSCLIFPLTTGSG